MDGDFNSELSVTRFDIVMFIGFVFDNYLNCISIYSCNRSFFVSTASPSFLWRRMAIQKNAFQIVVPVFDLKFLCNIWVENSLVLQFYIIHKKLESLILIS